MSVEVGSALPEVTLEGPDGPISLAELRGERPLVVLFYQEDATPLCTAQLCAFREDWDLVEELGAAVVGVSVDPVDSHTRFAEEERLPYPLLADQQLEAARAFDVVGENGTRSMRAAFVADAGGVLRAVLRHYHPANGEQYQAVFEALGLELG